MKKYQLFLGGLLAGAAIFVVIFVLTQIGTGNETGGWLGYAQNAAFVFNFSSLFIPAILSAVLFPNNTNGIADVVLINFFSLIQFSLLGGFALTAFSTKSPKHSVK
jgi:hypothetical protein